MVFLFSGFAFRILLKESVVGGGSSMDRAHISKLLLEKPKEGIGVFLKRECAQDVLAVERLL